MRLGLLGILGGEMYEALILSKENGDAGIDFADSKGYEHFGLRRGIGAWGFVCVGVGRALGKGALALYSIGSEGLGLGISSHCPFSFLCH